MPKISVLSDPLINKIAAGEVVARPSAVVKELVENSIDAGAENVEVMVEAGGKQLIAVMDDGHGIEKDQLSLAIARHATSKIREEKDLQSIVSFGFRGEALASIAAVSRFTLASRLADEALGHELSVAGAGPCNVLEKGMPCGTMVSVKELFYNVPARRKFLRQDNTEFGHLHEVLIRLALLQEGLGVQLTHNQKKIFHVSAKTNLENRLRILLKLKDAPLIAVQPEPADLEHHETPKLHGYVSPPYGCYGNRERLYLYVNGRSIVDRSLKHAVNTAYRELAPDGQYPVVVLNINLAADQVDVNVHPTKQEVRFQKPQAIYQFVLKRLRKLLSEYRPSETSTVPIAEVKRAYEGNVRRSIPARQKETSFVVSDQKNFFSKKATLPSSPIPIKSLRVNPIRHGFGHLQVLGQWYGSYLVCEDPHYESLTEPELILIDQHAAHERIGYERLKKSYKGKGIDFQSLLVPFQIELTALEFAVLESHLEQLKTLGLHVEVFGENTMIVRAVPGLLAKSNMDALMREVIQDLTRYGSSQAVEDLMDRILMTFSCHTMVRANHYLEREEMQALLKQLDEIDFSVKCPHGRPVFISLPLKEIERRFGRT